MLIRHYYAAQRCAAWQKQWSAERRLRYACHVDVAAPYAARHAQRYARARYAAEAIADTPLRTPVLMLLCHATATPHQPALLMRRTRRHLRRFDAMPLRRHADTPRHYATPLFTLAYTPSFASLTARMPLRRYAPLFYRCRCRYAALLMLRCRCF